METLKHEKGIAGIKPRASSLLVILDEEASVDNICRHLVESLPDLAAPEKKTIQL